MGVGNFDSSARRDIIDFIWPSYSTDLRFGMSQPKLLNQYFNIFRLTHPGLKKVCCPCLTIVLFA